jgi:sugar/nucleoside kinase (ribokinase family)
MRILIAGELNVDLVLQNYHSFPSLGREVLVDDVSLTLGSASAICAAGLARLGNQVAFAGKLGRDSWGDLCMDSLAKLGIDTSLVLRDSAIKTGITVSIASARDRALVTYLGSIGALQTADIPKEKLRDYRHLHISSFFLQQALRPDVKSMLAAAHGHGVTTSLDPGFDPADEWGRDLLDVLTEVDVFLPNEMELERITGRGDCIEGLRALQNGRTVTIAKLGAAGCLTLQNDAPLCISSFPVNAIDTTGAGDSFNAGFLHAWLRRQPLAEAMRFGAACGALSTQGLGGVATQATEAQAIEFIAGNS